MDGQLPGKLEQDSRRWQPAFVWKVVSVMGWSVHLTSAAAVAGWRPKAVTLATPGQKRCV